MQQIHAGSSIGLIFVSKLFLSILTPVLVSKNVKFILNYVYMHIIYVDCYKLGYSNYFCFSYCLSYTSNCMKMHFLNKTFLT